MGTGRPAGARGQSLPCQPEPSKDWRAVRLASSGVWSGRGAAEEREGFVEVQPLSRRVPLSPAHLLCARPWGLLAWEARGEQTSLPSTEPQSDTGGQEPQRQAGKERWGSAQRSPVSEEAEGRRASVGSRRHLSPA